MPVTDATLWVHGAPTAGAAFGAAGSQYSTTELDFGAGFPSYTEKGYTFPNATPGDGGVEFGLHIVVDAAFNTLTSISFQVCTSATTNALFSASPNPIGARTLTLAQLGVVGAHYFIPFSFGACLEFLRFYGAVTGSNPTTGTIGAWFGPKTGGEQ